MPPSKSFSIYSSEYLPPVSIGRWRAFERVGLQIRSFAGVGIHARLDPLELARMLDLRVVTLDDLKGLSAAARDLLTKGSAWSGGATTKLPDGSHIIILNPAHSAGRRAATLMEEISHILLGHKPTIINSQLDAGRDFDPIKETEAYGVGAAALLPYIALKESLAAGQAFRTIAHRFGVSIPMVGYRSKGLKLDPRPS